ncbi:MAG: M20/M25/M40 family metallo-hydrolase [Phycisphaerae bacterium]
MPLPKILRDLLSVPTAAFVESAVMEYVRRFCRRTAGVSARFDRYGNLLARYRNRPRAVTPLVFSAHTDHPGFIAQEMLDERTLRAAFRGGVAAEYFANAKVRFWSDGRQVNGKVLEVTKARRVRRGAETRYVPEETTLRVRVAVEGNSPGMWDLPAAFERDGNVYARDCDDIAGCAAMLALLNRLSRRKARADVYCLFTRAEEVGFIGAIGAAKAGTVSKKWPIIAIETSSELPNARIGDGPILRVGDRMSVFTPSVTAFCDRVAQKLIKRRKRFHFQRKLMDGGSCESTAFAAYGYLATGICLALGNYHNMDESRQKIACEYISLEDWKLMVDWFEALVLDETGYQADDPTVREGFDESFAKWLPLLEGKKSGMAGSEVGKYSPRSQPRRAASLPTLRNHSNVRRYRRIARCGSG